MILEAIEKAGYAPASRSPSASTALRPSSTRKASTYLGGEGRSLDRAGEWIDLLAGWVAKYPIISIEDGLAEDDWDGWKLLTDGARREGPARRRRPLRHQHRDAWSRASQQGVANSILIKVNQIGTLTETLDADRAGPAHRLHRGHQPPLRRDRGRDHRRHRRRHQRRPDQDRLASRTDRIAKYNQLLRIEEDLGDDAVYGPGRVRAAPQLVAR